MEEQTIIMRKRTKMDDKEIAEYINRIGHYWQVSIRY